MSTNVEIGKLGEQLAKDYLIAKGLVFKQANYRFQHLEIDLILESDRYLVIVEVKARYSTEFGQPFEAITRRKQSQVIKAANQYIQQVDSHKEVRFDVISIVLKNPNDFELEHIEDAFTP